MEPIEFDYDDEMLNSVHRWENMVRSHKRYFFDVEELEDIIDYYMDTDDFNQASQVADYAEAIYPTATSIQLRIAEILIDKGQPAKALTLLNKLEQLESGDYAVYLMKGSALNMLGKARDAQRQFEKAISLADEDKIGVLYEIGSSFERINQYEIALKYFLKVLSMEPDNFYLYYDVAYCYDRLDDFDNCIAYYLKFLDEDPFSEHVWYNLGIVYNRHDEDAKAIEAYDYALAIDPRYSSALFNKANTLTLLNRYDEAIEAYQDFIDIEPDSAAAFCYLGECYEKKDNDATAMLCFAKSLTLDESFADAWYGMGIIYAQNENYEEAVSKILHALKLDKNNTEYTLALASIYANMDMSPQAMKLFRHLVATTPGDELIWDSFAQAHIQQQKFVEAQQIATEGLQKNPESALLRYHLAAFYLLNDDRLQGLTILKEALNLYPDDVEMFFELFNRANRDDEVMALIHTIRKDL